MSRHTPRKGRRRSDSDGIRLLAECLRHTATIASAVASTIHALITVLGPESCQFSAPDPDC